MSDKRTSASPAGRRAPAVNSTDNQPRGLQWWAAWVIIAAAMLTGMLISSAGDGTLNRWYFLCFAVASVACTLLVRVSGLLLTVAIQPIFYALLTPVCTYLAAKLAGLSSNTASFSKTAILTYCFPEVQHFPWLAWTFGISVVLALVRLLFYRWRATKLETARQQALRSTETAQRRNSQSTANYRSREKQEHRQKSAAGRHAGAASAAATGTSTSTSTASRHSVPHQSRQQSARSAGGAQRAEATRQSGGSVPTSSRRSAQSGAPNDSTYRRMSTQNRRKEAVRRSDPAHRHSSPAQRPVRGNENHGEDRRQGRPAAYDRPARIERPRRTANHPQPRPQREYDAPAARRDSRDGGREATLRDRDWDRDTAARFTERPSRGRYSPEPQFPNRSTARSYPDRRPGQPDHYSDGAQRRAAEPNEPARSARGSASGVSGEPERMRRRRLPADDYDRRRSVNYSRAPEQRPGRPRHARNED